MRLEQMLQMILAKRKEWVVGSVILYFGLSVVCFSAHSTAVLRNVFDALWKFVWLLGPPALLLYRSNYLHFYSVGTLLVAVATAGAVFLVLRGSDVGGLVLGLLAVVIWVGFGLLTYAPTF